jgi:serine/threonine protein kinase
LTEKCGTPCYVAPEILRGIPYGTQCDIFSLGSLLFNLITGKYLFKGSNKLELLQKNYDCDLTTIRSYLEKAGGEHLVDLTIKMLNVNPYGRPTAREALKHPFFKQDEQIIQSLLLINDTYSKSNMV